MAAVDAKLLPRHIAIIMDGNGRWAAARGLSRTAGHKAGLKAVRLCVEQCSRRGVEALTLFAFSSENWQRPALEVSSLMSLFLEAIDKEIDELHAQAVRVRFIGARGSLSMRLQTRIAAAEERTRANAGLKLQIAMSYGGRWDIIQAAQAVARECASGAARPEDITEDSFGAHMGLAGVPQADLLVRTGGEQRISNFLLWDLAYAEL
jgi:undecaprenyl diphosphate synthase